MGINSILGYISALLGLGVFAATSKTILAKVVAILPFMAKIPVLYLMILAGVLVVIGIALIMTEGNTKTQADVPIYDKTGKKVVGYRRMK